MASVDIGIEAGPLEFDLSAGIRSLDERMAKLADRLEKLGRRDGRLFRRNGNASTGPSFTGSGPIAILVGRPPDGHLWIVQWCVPWVGVSVAAGTTANLNCAIMAGRCPAGESQIYNAANANVPVLVSDIIIPSEAVPPPPVGMPSIGEVRPQEQLYVLLGGSGLAANTQYNAIALILDVPDQSGAPLWH